MGNPDCIIQARAPRIAEILGCAALILSVHSEAAAAGRTFYALSDLTFDKSRPVLINARPANPADFPGVFYSFSESGACTSTLVGEKVLMTAAHCVPNQGKVTLERQGVTYSGTCERPDSYPADVSADWALCAMDTAPDVLHETVNQDPSLLSERMSLLLSGFGCVAAPGVGGNDGVYRIGTSQISRLPSGTSNDIQTTGGAALCFGDSGGPAFIVSPAAIANPGAPGVLDRRLAVSVNSRGNIKDLSILVSTSTPAAKAFFQTWIKKHGLTICGFSPSALRCRTGA